MLRPACTALVALGLLAACSDGERVSTNTNNSNAVDTAPDPSVSAPLANAPLALGTWRGTLTLPGGELPFALEIALEDGALVAYLINGAERVRVPETRAVDGTLELRMPGFENRLWARIDGDALKGEVILVKRDGNNQVLPFAARFGETYRFEAAPTSDNADVAGRWAVTFVDAHGKRTQAVGEFKQQSHAVTGTFLTPTGDHRFLAGDVNDNRVRLSAFDGSHAFLYDARIEPSGEMTGTFWSGLKSRESFTARRDAQASLGDAEGATRLRAEATRFDFTFPDLDGKPVSLSSARFRNKVVVIALAGSWCPNCHDEAQFLAPWYAQHRARGLEVVSLMFEHFGDFERAVAATRRFRERFGIEYTTLIAGISDKQDAGNRLPQLNGVFAFPTTIFVDRQGRVRKIHTGFSGPATGEHHRKLIDEFETLADQLLDESGDPLAARPGGA